MTHLPRALFAASLLLLTAVLAQAATPLEDEISKLALAEGEGLVVLKAVMPKTYFGTTAPNWMGLSVRKDDSEKAALLTNLADRQDDYSLFLTKLPAGSYSLLNLNVVVPKQTVSQYGGTYSSEHFVLQLGDPRFEVQAGAVSDLGVAITLPRNTAKVLPSQSSGSVRTEQPVIMVRSHSAPESARLIEMLQAKWPKLTALHVSESWLTGIRIPLSVLSDAMPQLQRIGAGLQLGPDGKLYSGEALGQVRVTATDGTSKWVSTDLSSPISALALGEDGTLVAGASMGLLAMRSPGTTEWQALPLPQLDSRPIELSIGRQGLYVLARRDRDVHLLHRAGLASPAPWAVLKRFSISSVGSSRFEMRVTGDGISILEHATGWSAGTQLHHYDTATKAWTQTEIPTDWSTGRGAATLTPEGHVVSAKGKRGTPQVMRVSADHGKTWAEAAGPDLFETVHMSSRTHGFASRNDTGRNPLADFRSYTYSLWATEDGGLSWRKLGATPVTFGQVIRMSDDVLVAVEVRGEVYRSANNGASWQKH